MKFEIDLPEHQYNNIIALNSLSLGRVPYKGIIMYAINAIKNATPVDQEPTTKNDLEVDLISRADAIKAMQDKAKKLKNEDTINGLCGAVAILFDMPSVTPQEPRKGHWINTANPRMSDNIVCSECGYNSIADYKYCPNCGSYNGGASNGNE